jgi:SAM-dependent methyltransferase
MKLSYNKKYSVIGRFGLKDPFELELKRILLVSILLILISNYTLFAQKSNSAFCIPRVKYSGGGDWYNDPSAEVNLLKFIAKNTNIKTNPVFKFVDLATTDIFDYSFLFLTGHGNINFSEKEVQNLRTFLENGGFLYVDDDYGLDPFIRKEMKKVFPEQNFVEIPFSHGIFSCHFQFPGGVPKIHEHDNKPPKSYGLFYQERLVVFYTYESNPSDGWADPDVHNDPPEKRELALKFGTNIVVWALEH